MSGEAITLYYAPFSPQPGASRELLFRAAARYLGLPGFSCAIETGPWGKPYFAGEGLPGFSLSHSGEYWICALGSGALGLDLQLHQAASPEKLSRRFFHPLEDAYLRRNGYRAFFDLWAAKESYVKLSGRGITQGLDGFSLVSPEGRFPVAEDCRLRLLPFAPGYSLCLAAAEIGPTELRQL